MKFVKVAVCWMSLAAAGPVLGMDVAEVTPGIYRGPAPRSETDYRQLTSLGIKTVLDLRTVRKRRMEEECRCVTAHGMTYLRSGVSFYPRKDGSADQALCRLTEVNLQPVYIHCELGRDRSGLVIAMYRVRCQGWSLQAAYCEMDRFGFHHYLRGLERYFWNCTKK
jgi:protein tyrosine/serine phosphatase